MQNTPIAKRAVFGIFMSATLAVSAAALAATSSHPPAKALVFPAGTDPHFYRQGVSAPCVSGETCSLGFDKIAANHFLQIDKITCQGSFSYAVLYRGLEIVPDAAHMVAVFDPPNNTNGFVSSASGPFYFAAGEKPTIQTLSNIQAFCSIFGTLWTTQ